MPQKGFHISLLIRHKSSLLAVLTLKLSMKSNIIKYQQFIFLFQHMPNTVKSPVPSLI